MHQALSYLEYIVSKHPLYVHLLLFLDIGMHIQSKNRRVFIDQLVKTRLLNKPRPLKKLNYQQFLFEDKTWKQIQISRNMYYFLSHLKKEEAPVYSHLK